MGCFLDIKDLQFIRDVLKDATFSNTKWFDLGLKLKLLEPDLKAISSASNDDSNCLRECLALLLKSGNASTPQLLQPDLEAISSASNDASDCLRECLTLWLRSGNATPHLLVHSLESVDEAPAAEYARKICKHNNNHYILIKLKTFIVLDEANQLLLSYRDKLSQSFLTDDLLGLLRSEGVISKDTQEMIIEYDNILDGKPFRAVCVTVADDHQKLKVLADVLLQSSETAPLGRDLADKYCESIIIILSVINFIKKVSHCC